MYLALPMSCGQSLFQLLCVFSFEIWCRHCDKLCVYFMFSGSACYVFGARRLSIKKIVLRKNIQNAKSCFFQYKVFGISMFWEIFNEPFKLSSFSVYKDPNLNMQVDLGIFCNSLSTFLALNEVTAHSSSAE